MLPAYLGDFKARWCSSRLSEQPEDIGAAACARVARTSIFSQSTMVATVAK